MQSDVFALLVVAVAYGASGALYLWNPAWSVQTFFGLTVTGGATSVAAHLGALIVGVGLIALSAAQRGTADGRRRLLQVLLTMEVIHLGALLYRDNDAEPNNVMFALVAAATTLIFGHTYIFKGALREVIDDPLKTALYTIGAATLWLGIYADNWPSAFGHLVMPGVKLTSVSLFLLDQAGAAMKAVGTALVYAAASGVDHERRRAAQAMIVAQVVMIINDVVNPDGDSHHLWLDVADEVAVIVVLVVVLYVLKSKPVAGEAHTSSRGTNAVLTNTLLAVGALGLLVNAITFTPPVVRDKVLNVMFPEANGKWEAVDLAVLGALNSYESALHVLAVYAARQGGAHEQRRVAQVLVFFTALGAHASWATPANGDVNEVHIGIMVAIAVALLVGLYGVPASSGSAGGKTPKKGAAAAESDAGSTPAAKGGRGGRPRANSTPKRK